MSKSAVMVFSKVAVNAVGRGESIASPGADLGGGILGVHGSPPRPSTSRTLYTYARIIHVRARHERAYCEGVAALALAYL